MNLVEQINKLLRTQPLEVIGAGQIVKAIILNGLGFVSAKLYLFEQFFVGIATNLTKERKKILAFFGAPCQKYYFLA